MLKGNAMPNKMLFSWFKQHLTGNSSNWTLYHEIVGSEKGSYAVKNLRPYTLYKVRMSATNAMGYGDVSEYPHWITTAHEGLLCCVPTLRPHYVYAYMISSCRQINEPEGAILPTKRF